MSLPVKISDNTGNEYGLKVNEEGTIGVVEHPHPPTADPIFVIPYANFFTSDGLPADGTNNDMQVVGSLASPVEFFIQANADTDTYIKNITFEISDSGATLNKFGNITALSNGVVFKWVTQDKGTAIIDTSLKSNYEFIRLCNDKPAFGTTTSSFRASNVNGTSEGYLPRLNVEEMFGIRYGFRLRKGTTDKLVFSVQDNTTGVDSFNIKAFGQQL